MENSFEPILMARQRKILKIAKQLLLHSVILLLVSICHCYKEQFEAFGTSELSRNRSQILNLLINKTYYDKRLRPNYGGPTVDVGITMHVSSISAVSEVEMDYTLDFYLRQNWHDPRLDINRLGAKEELTVSWEYTKDIWLPDTFFPNEKKSYFHQATTHNSFLRIKGRGEVLTSQRLTVTASCPMMLQLFPLDSQECTLEIESYGYSDADTKYRWLENKTVTMDEVSLPQFYVAHFAMKNRTITLSTGDYSRLNVKFVFVRNIGFYLMQIYIPSMLIVIISWVSFWIHRDASPARVSLGVTTVLTMTTLMTTTNASLPKVSYIKAIDIYLGTCFVMVFASLIEYAAVSYLNKKMKMRREQRQRQEKVVQQVQPLPAPPPASEAMIDPLMPLHFKFVQTVACGGGQNPESRNPERSKSRMGQNPEGSKSYMGQNPEGSKSRIGRKCTTQMFSVDGYSDADIRLYWLQGYNSVTFDQEIRKLPTFELQDLYIVERKISLSTGDYSRLSLHLTFVRNLGFYWVQIYQPSIMVVTISWVSFWISRDSAPARVTLGIMTVLTMTTLMTSTNSQLPKVSYAKAVDIYLGFGFVLVFCALIEYAMVSYTVKRQNDRRIRSAFAKSTAQTETPTIPEKPLLTPLHRLPPPMKSNAIETPLIAPWKHNSVPERINQHQPEEPPCNCGKLVSEMVCALFSVCKWKQISCSINISENTNIVLFRGELFMTRKVLIVFRAIAAIYSPVRTTVNALTASLVALCPKFGSSQNPSELPLAC
ncbi:hypothetical protein M514_05763 [Trichuris suis]|uniref:Gamma-aminobutyric acid receptor subunit beta n=1 Tax=Trichuris suis TaxID=68888 RepID=A0A085NA67_9BILA|nr:hypothetical protein M514_05763 [Trichuris suis]